MVGCVFFLCFRDCMDSCPWIPLVQYLQTNIVKIVHQTASYLQAPIHQRHLQVLSEFVISFDTCLTARRILQGWFEWSRKSCIREEGSGPREKQGESGCWLWGGDRKIYVFGRAGLQMSAFKQKMHAECWVFEFSNRLQAQSSRNSCKVCKWVPLKKSFSQDV